MPLHWKIAPLEQMVGCVSEGVVTKDELMSYFKAIEEAGAAHYRKMLDASRAMLNNLAEKPSLAEQISKVGVPPPAPPMMYPVVRQPHFDEGEDMHMNDDGASFEGFDDDEEDS